ncbi:MAG: translation initiation factor IF-6 [Candidatus Diapherotrites archaeon]|nr:translation initiation factor IF-6 [Candidatus Diapherotrites archaeon]
MRIEKKNLSGNPFIGIFCSTSNKITLVPPSAPESFVNIVEQVLGTEPVRATLYNSSLIGIFSVLNSNGILVPETVYETEIEQLRSLFGKVGVIHEFTAITNLIACNDKGCIASPVFSKNDVKTIKDTLGVGVTQAKVAGLDVVGSSVVANNKGFLTNPNITDDDLKLLNKVFKVEGTVGSINYGSPFVRGGLLANDKGAVTGMLTTAYEIGRIDEALFFGRDENEH